MEWNRFSLRKTDEEEKEFFGVGEIWETPVPDSEQKVLISNGIDIWVDEWYQDSDGANLMDSDALGLYWLPLPDLPKVVAYQEKKNAG